MSPNHFRSCSLGPSLPRIVVQSCSNCGRRIVRHSSAECRPSISDGIVSFSAPGSGANLYTRSRTIVSAGLGYQVRPAVSLSLDVQNIFNTPQSWYRGVPDQLAQIYIPGITVTAGVSGRF